MFPRDFWFDVSLAVGVLTAIEGALLALAAYSYIAWLNRGRRRTLTARAPAVSEGS
jgi:hypothetical protein